MLWSRKLQSLAKGGVGSGFTSPAADGKFQREQVKRIAKLQVSRAKIGRTAFVARYGRHDSPPKLKNRGGRRGPVSLSSTTLSLN